MLAFVFSLAVGAMPLQANAFAAPATGSLLHARPLSYFLCPTFRRQSWRRRVATFPRHVLYPQPCGVRSLRNGIASTWERWGEEGDVSSWGADNGIWCPWNVVERGDDRSVVAADPCKPGDIICRVPRKAAWEVSLSAPPTVPAAFISPSYWNTADATSEKTGWYVKLAAKLLYEHSLGETSAWAPYLSCLPASVDTLIHWSADELEQLQNSRLVRQVRCSFSSSC